jgi:serralysin
MAEMSAYEQLVLELINRARLDPGAEAARLGIDLNQGLEPGTLSNTTRAPLAGNPLLVDAARSHSAWMNAADIFSHTGSGKSTPWQRMEAAGYNYTSAGENISWNGTTGTLNHLAATVINHDGLFRSAGHRLNILNADFREVGIGDNAGQFTTGGVTYNSLMLTQNFGRSGANLFITGVAYNDLDGDKFYDVGEGRGGVSVRISQGGSTVATTATQGAGGYAQGVANGTYDVTFSSGGLAAPVTAAVVMQGVNVKIDLLGTGEIHTSATTTLKSGATALKLLGLEPLNGTGNAANNIIWGNKAANVLNGLAGADTMRGGLGNDTYYVDNAGDKVIELSGQGTDRVIATVSHVLAGYVENLTLGGTTAINGTGNGLNNIIVGNAADNTLSGGAGNDTLSGAAGNDRLNGGTGNDTLTGGLGLDAFLFNTALNAATNRDIIKDFVRADDTIQLENAIFTKLVAGVLPSSQFRAGAAALDSNDYIVYSIATGVLAYDADGNGAGAAIPFAVLATKPVIAFDDFLVV